jgi:plastocyanin domain-containing protein
MSIMEWIVIISGLAAIVWINWYFFVAQGSAASATIGTGGVQQITVAVESGYHPAVVYVRKKRPVQLVFERREQSGCSEEIAIPEFGVRKFLPAFQKTTIELVPTRAGTFEFTCGMGMLRGRLIVQG